MATVTDKFNLYQGNSFDLISMEIDNKSHINFVSRTGENNGVVAKVKEVPDRKPFPAGLITVALGGSVLSSFVQAKPFYTGYHIMVLEPKKEMSFQEKMFYALCIQKNAYRYSYGRQANKTLKNLELPDEVPKWVKDYKINYINTNNTKNAQELLISKWKQFKVKNVFNCETTKALDINEFIEGNINYITRSAFDNGYSGKCGNVEYITKGNCITIGAEGKNAFYQNNDFVAGVKVYSLRNKMLNKYNALFITTLLNKKVELYSYGRARILEKIKEENINLPVTSDNQIDWNYMENYIKSLPYADNI